MEYKYVRCCLRQKHEDPLRRPLRRLVRAEEEALLHDEGGVVCSIDRQSLALVCYC
jgi:hypothetical protein